MAETVHDNRKLLWYKRELLREKIFLCDLQKNISDQINALKVEQLHLTQAMNASKKSQSEPKTCLKTNNCHQQQPELLNKTLDLSINNVHNYSEEEDSNDE